MKKLLGVFLIIIIAMLSLTACADGYPNGENNLGGNSSVDGNGESGGNNGATTKPTTSSTVLIVYFSCTNTTEAIAKHIEATTNGAIYKIIPEIPYTEDDLKYYTNCRADKEQADINARPAISGSVENMSQYNIVFLGYPIWHGQAPRIISTFLESYDFSNKTIVPFCTSHSSGIGSSDSNLHSLAPDAEWLTGKRFASGTSESTVADWINSLGLKFAPEQSQGQESTKMFITINGNNKLEVTLADNSAVDELIKILQQGDIVYTANDYGGFEKVGSLGHTLTTENNSQITTQAGDVILYSGSQIVIFYDSNSWSYTRLGKINGYSAAELRSLLLAGNNNVEVRLSLR